MVWGHVERLRAEDGRGYRRGPFMAAGTGAISLIEIPPGLPVPDTALGLWRALAWLHDDGGGPVAFPDADALLAWGTQVLITDQTRASGLVYTLAVGMAASLGRAVLVETAPARINEWHPLAERHAPGRVVVLPSDADALPDAAAPAGGGVTVH